MERKERGGVREDWCSISDSQVLDPLLESRVPPSLRLRPVSPDCHVIPLLTGVLQSLHQLLHGRSHGLGKILGSSGEKMQRRLIFVQLHTKEDKCSLSTLERTRGDSGLPTGREALAWFAWRGCGVSCIRSCVCSVGLRSTEPVWGSSVAWLSPCLLLSCSEDSDGRTEPVGTMGSRFGVRSLVWS